jgi:hypothetical protein
MAKVGVEKKQQLDHGQKFRTVSGKTRGLILYHFQNGGSILQRTEQLEYG